VNVEGGGVSTGGDTLGGVSSPEQGPPAVPFADSSRGEPAVRGLLHRPLAPARGALVLTHGASSNADAPILIAVAAAFTGAGFVVLRCDLPYRQHRPTGPPSPAAAHIDREGLRRAVLAVQPMAPGCALLGGHSYGGRQASMLVADQPGLVDAILLLSYPLHPPRNRHERRTTHFDRLRTPALFVHGSRDPFGSLDEMRAAIASIPSPTVVVPVDGAGHDLGIRRGGERAAGLAARVLAETLALVEGPPRRAS
jgi:hypothetical protein